MTSFLDSIQRDTSQSREKMSKSRGNGISVDMVVHGVASIKEGHEFRDFFGNKINNWKPLNIWRNKHGDGQFYCGVCCNGINRQYLGDRFEWLPVFIAITGERWPCRLRINDKDVMQHSRLFEFWEDAARQDPDEFFETGNVSYYLRRNDYERAGVYCKHG